MNRPKGRFELTEEDLAYIRQNFDPLCDSDSDEESDDEPHMTDHSSSDISYESEDEV